MMTFDSATVAEMRQSAPDMFAEIDALRAAGKPIAHILVDGDTDEVFISEGPGQPYEKALGVIREMVTGTPCPDPGRFNPLASRRVLRDPARKARHDAKVRGMIVQLVDYYSPRLAQHPRADRVFDVIAASVERNRTVLEAEPSNYGRWDLITENTIDLLDSLQASEPGETEEESAPSAG